MKNRIKPNFIQVLVAVSLFVATTNIVWAAEQIITFGDSITSGVKQDGARTVIFCAADGVTTPPPYVCNGEGRRNVGGYQPFVRTLLAAQGVPSDQYNWGFAGKESDQLLGDISGVLAARPSEYVFIMVGINDVNESVFSTSTTVFNIERIVDRVLADGRIPVLGTVTPWIFNSLFNARVQQINVGIRAYAAREDIPVVVADHYAALIGNFSAFHSGDGVHLRSAGNLVVANQWVNAFLESGLSSEDAAIQILPGVHSLLLD